MFGIQRETCARDIQRHSQSTCGTFDYIDHRPGGGDKKVSVVSKISLHCVQY